MTAQDWPRSGKPGGMNRRRFIALDLAAPVTAAAADRVLLRPGPTTVLTGAIGDSQPATTLSGW
jgi:hypothetical protein